MRVFSRQALRIALPAMALHRLAQQGCGASNTPFIQVPSHFPETVITNTGCPCCV